jgi:predicted Zn-dependent protease
MLSQNPTEPSNVPRIRLKKVVALLIIAAGVLIATSMSVTANPFGPTQGCCRYADSSTHTWLDAAGSGNAAAAWESYFEAAMDYDLSPTDMTESEVTYHNIGTNYVDVEWYTASLAPPAIGVAQCVLAVASDPTRCEHWHVRFNYPTSSTSTGRHHTACHEIGHTVGLDHETSSANSSSCMYGNTSSVTFSSHDTTTHINVKY